MFPNNPLPAKRLDTFVKAWIEGVDGVTYTPKGLAFSGGYLYKKLNLAPWMSKCTGGFDAVMHLHAKAQL